MTNTKLTNKQKRYRDRIINELEKIEAGGLHGQLPVIWSKALDSTVHDIFGNSFIDFTSTIFVANCGHGAISEAIYEQSNELIHSYTFPTITKLKFLKDFKQFLPKFCERIFLASAGSEVASWAINLMRAYKGKRIIVHIDGAFHGKTGSIANLSSEELSICFSSRYEDWPTIRKTLEEKKADIAGIMIESYQGWSAKFMDKHFIQMLVVWAKQNDIPVCFDEIQGGFWRTGKKFAYEWYQVLPDLICMGKGLGNGLPISALAGKAKYFNVSGLSSTHSGNPLCCAGARKAIEIYRKLNPTRLERKGTIFQKHLLKLKEAFSFTIKEVNAHGLLGAIIFKSVADADAICNLCVDKGLLVVRTGRESIKLGPPLTITEEELKKGLIILELAISEHVLRSVE